MKEIILKFYFSSLKKYGQCCVFSELLIRYDAREDWILLGTQRTGNKEWRGQVVNDKKCKGTRAQVESWPWRTKPNWTQMKTISCYYCLKK